MRQPNALWAADPGNSRGRHHGGFHHDDSRSPFQRDRDRIIHCGAFRRLKHKTQVFIYHEGDYFRTRLTHSLEVAQIARSIARRLAADDDLAEAIALAHDLGHTPFGHAGETRLQVLMQNYGGFDHNEQTVRIISSLEHCYADFDGLNLSWETLEGVIKHNGPINGEDIRPTIASLNKLMDFKLPQQASAEAQIAALADDIAYIAHDCDDGIRAGLVSIEAMMQAPMAGPILYQLEQDYGRLETSRLVHELTRRLIKLAVDDLFSHSQAALQELQPGHADDIRRHDKPVIGFSDEMTDQLAALKAFLFKTVWRHYKVNRMTSKAKRIMADLFELFMEETNVLPHEWQLIDGTSINSVDETRRARHVADYIASMTDRYALMEHERLFDPGPILR